MCRAEEQSASVYGKGGKPASMVAPVVVRKTHSAASGGRIADTPNERLVDVLREALDIAEGQDDYLLDNCTPASEATRALGEATATAPWAELHASGKTMFRFSNAWTTDLVEAKTLAMFAYMLKARRVMEIACSRAAR